MTTLAKIVIAGILALGAIGALGGVAIAQASNGADDRPGVELRGPCDEAEHATDSRCTGTRAPVRQLEDRVGADDRQRRHHRHHGVTRGIEDNSASHGGRSGRSHAEDR
jgi:hypothetical protein